MSKGIAIGTARPTALSRFGAKIETRDAQKGEFIKNVNLSKIKIKVLTIRHCNMSNEYISKQNFNVNFKAIQNARHPINNSYKHNWQNQKPRKL